MTRNAYTYDRDGASKAAGLVCGPSLAQQNFKDECDINNLVRSFGLGAKMPENLRLPRYGDFSHISSFHDAVNAIAQARETFDSLPAATRDFFRNDPQRFVAFCEDEKNRDKAVELGLIQTPETHDREGRRLPTVVPTSATPVAVPAQPTAAPEAGKS